MEKRKARPGGSPQSARPSARPSAPQKPQPARPVADSPQWQQALAFHQQGQLEQAAALYEVILNEQPRHADALHLLGMIALHGGQAQRAAELIGRSVEINPGQFTAHTNLGFAWKALGQRENALRCFEQTVALKPDFVDGWIHRGNLLAELDRPSDSLASFDAALAVSPDHLGALNNRGDALRKLKRHDEALACFERALTLEPDRPDALLNQGTVWLEIDRPADALRCFDRLIGNHPQHALAWSNRGNALSRLQREARALESFDQALSIQPGYTPAWVNRANTLLALCRYEEARASFARALALEPDSSMARWNASILDLLEARFDTGWRGYESRWSVPGLEAARHTHVPRWSGAADIRGKRILLWHEQGLGDTLQFCRYARTVAALGAEPVLEVQPALKRLLASNLAGMQVCASGEPVPSCDFAIPLMSLPLACGLDLGTAVPAPAYLNADPAGVAAWQTRLGPRRHARRIGIAFSGNTTHRNDSNRSISAAQLGALTGDHEWLVIQKGLRDGDAQTLSRLTEVRYFGDDLHDFGDTAALIANLDLVITVDTSLAHLAGGMGKPVWVLLPANPDWRWQLGREDTPWYASARLFRQAVAGDWDEVLERVRQALLVFG
jgi:tetratricopeptide (TPR) repeat protein